jgi:hypothetical protein
MNGYQQLYEDSIIGNGQMNRGYFDNKRVCKGGKWNWSPTDVTLLSVVAG